MPRRKNTTLYKALSLGWGVQSFTLAAMSALGALEKLDAVVHSDTEHEKATTYDFAERWTPWLIENGMNVVTVVSHHKLGTDIYNTETTQIQIPAFIVSEHGKGRINRQCTHSWKIAPVRRYLQEQRDASQPVELWLGISLDEKRRVTESDVMYITNRYPLIELGMTRQDCIDWLSDHNIEVPSKSACTFCPFHNKQAWKDMKRENGPDWKDAVRVDKEIRNVIPTGQSFVHSSGLPLEDAVLIGEDELVGNGIDKLYQDAECEESYCFV